MDLSLLKPQVRMPTPVNIGKYGNKQAGRIAEFEISLSSLESLLSRSQEILARHFDPGVGLGSDEALSELPGLLDGPEQRRIQSEAWRLLKIKHGEIIK
jgi:hypothetical protein